MYAGSPCDARDTASGTGSSTLRTRHRPYGKTAKAPRISDSSTMTPYHSDEPRSSVYTARMVIYTKNAAMYMTYTSSPVQLMRTRFFNVLGIPTDSGSLPGIPASPPMT